MTNAPKTQQALNNIKSRLGQKIGSGQCYGLVAYYSQLLGGCNIGGGINNPNPDGNGRQAGGSDPRRGMSASNIGGDYNWQAKGWQVKFSPVTMADLKAGAIVNTKPPAGSYWRSDYDYAGNPWGHTVVVTSANGSSYDIIEQNFNYKQYLTERKGISTVADIESIIYPPELVSGGVVSTVTASAPSVTTGGGDVQTTAFDVEAVLIDIDGLPRFTPNIYEIPNLLKVAYDDITKALRDYTGNKNLEIEFQLLNSEFTEIELFDVYGNSYAYQPQYLPRTIDENEKYKVIVTGSLGDSNQVHIGLLKYNNGNAPSYAGKNIYNIANTGTMLGWQRSNPEHYKYGINDITGRNLAILNDAEASYIQGNKNQMEATQLSFKEQRDILKQNVDLSNKKVNQANAQASYNAQFAVDSANINQWGTGISSTAGVLGNLFSGNIGGAVSGLFSGGMNTYQAMRGYDNAVAQQEFTDKNNALNKQSNALANMQAKIALDQSIRSYNASMADLQNQPISVQQIGNDLSFQAGNDISDIYWRVALAQKEVLKRANDYIKWYGVIVNTFTPNIMAVRRNRKRFNYIKMITVNIGNLRANQSHLSALQAIFQSGVRIWNYSEIKDEAVLFDVSPNNPSYE